jgi:hypothetical protein
MICFFYSLKNGPTPALEVTISVRILPVRPQIRICQKPLIYQCLLKTPLVANLEGGYFLLSDQAINREFIYP